MQRNLSQNHLMQNSIHHPKQMPFRPNSANPETGEVHQRFEYELLWHYNSMTEMEMIIPDGGKFPDEENWGEKHQRRAVKVYVAAAVFGSCTPVKPRATRRRVQAPPLTGDMTQREVSSLVVANKTQQVKRSNFVECLNNTPYTLRTAIGRCLARVKSATLPT